MSSTSEAMRGKTVLVTGATGQVGWGVARAAVRAGARVVLPVRAGARALGPSLEGPTVVVVECDLTDETSVTRLRDVGVVDHVAAPLGAWWQKGPSLAQPPRELRDLLAVYVEAQWLLMKTLAPALRQSGGSYTIITGAAGEGMVPDGGLLVTAVRSQYALSKVLRHELAGEPFRVNEVRIACRIERDARPGVVPAEDAGADFVAVMAGAHRGEVLRYAADRTLVAMAGS